MARKKHTMSDREIAISTLQYEKSHDPEANFRIKLDNKQHMKQFASELGELNRGEIEHVRDLIYAYRHSPTEANFGALSGECARLNVHGSSLFRGFWDRHEHIREHGGAAQVDRFATYAITALNKADKELGTKGYKEENLYTETKSDLHHATRDLHSLSTDQLGRAKEALETLTKSVKGMGVVDETLHHKKDGVYAQAIASLPHNSTLKEETAKYFPGGSHAPKFSDQFAERSDLLHAELAAVKEEISARNVQMYGKAEKPNFIRNDVVINKANQLQVYLTGDNAMRYSSDRRAEFDTQLSNFKTNMGLDKNASKDDLLAALKTCVTYGGDMNYTKQAIAAAANPTDLRTGVAHAGKTTGGHGHS